MLATVFFFVDLYPLANVNVFHLKAEPTEGRRQHLSKTEGKKKTYLQISPFSLI